MSDEQEYWFNGYIALGMAAVAGLVIQALAIAKARVSASRAIHAKLLKRVVGANISFFDVTPTGRILNRFTSDMDGVDMQLGRILAQFGNSFSDVVMNLITVIIATKGFFAILLIPVSIFFNYSQAYFRQTTTEVQRLDSMSKSPIFSHFSETLTGLSTIRAFGCASQFEQVNSALLDSNNVANFTKKLLASWLSIRLEVIGSLTAVSVAGYAVLTHDLEDDRFTIPIGWIAVGLISALQYTNTLKFCVQVTAEAEAQMTCVERIRDSATTIEQEEQTTIEAAPASETALWPSVGMIELEAVKLRYREGPLVLKGIDARIEGCAKVGVCGRTGSGKSSLIVGLFRIVELNGGSIKIDGKNIASVPLELLRSRLGIIPQEPVLFQDTVRYNLDPFSMSTDDELWSALDKCQLGTVIRATPQGMGHEVSEGGGNFSVGQRQLMCLARALLRQPKVLVLDEATASVDQQTDDMIQTMLRTEFTQSTVLTIAHRIHTILDCDQILVLDGGLLLEQGPPQSLLAKGGAFASLVKASESASNASNASNGAV